MNLILDPLFIIYFKLGVVGIALATVAVKTFVLIYLYKKVKKSELFQNDKKLWELKKPNLKNWLEVIHQGIPASLNMMTLSIATFILNYFVQRAGGNMAIATFGVTRRID